MTATTRSPRPLVWGAAVLIPLLAVVIAAARWARPAQDPLELGRAAYAKGDWERALARARAQIKTSSADPEAWRLYARSQARLNRDDSATAVYRDRLGQSQLEPEDFFLLGLGMVHAGKLELALEIWLKAMRSGPDFPELLDHLTRLSFRMQHLDESAEAARKLANQPGWEARGWLVLGEVEFMLDNPAGAADALKKGLEYDPAARGLPYELAHYQLLLARMLLNLGRPAEAESLLKAVIAAGTSATAEPIREANWLASRAYLQQGKISEATTALADAGTYRADNPLASDPGPFVGAKECAPCHVDEDRKYRSTRHSRTFHRGPALLDLPIPDHPLTDPDNPKVTHTFERSGGKVQVATRAGENVYNTIVDYAFGTRDRYITMIGRDDNRDYRAVRMSYFKHGDHPGWTRTFGSPTADELVRGQSIVVRDGVNRCLYCHTTRSRDFREPPPTPGPSAAVADRAIGCERCHGPGTNHIAAIKYDFPDRATVNVGPSTAANINRQCADCHIVGSRAEIEADPENPMYVRSSAATLPISKCFTESGGRLSCLTCHDPHTDSEKSAGYYETACLKCHSAASSTTPGQMRVVACPVNSKTNCLECHMPKVEVPVLRTTMTDHYIRIRKPAKPGEPSSGEGKN